MRDGMRDKYGYHEMKEHAGKDFPFNIYPCSIPADFSQVPVHWHEDMEMAQPTQSFPETLQG